MQHATDSGESDDGYQSYAALYAAYDALLADKERDAEENKAARNALQRFLRHRTGGRQRDGFIRMQQCRDALDALDRQGWNRSFHQRMFHENFIRACARVFFKTEPQGSFARAPQAILDIMDQAPKDIPTTFSRDKMNVLLDVPAVGGKFDGLVSADLSTISGRWTQSGAAGAPVPLILHRKAP